MSALQSLETNLEDVFVKNAPALPENGKKMIVEYLPWINLVLGLISLYTVYMLWHWAHLLDAANKFIDYANSITQAYGGTTVAGHRLSVVVWASMAVMAVQAVLYILAFPALRARKKSGWDLLFYALLVNVVYGVVVLFSDYGGVGNLIGSLIGSAVGFYFLFQIRSLYLKAPAAAK
ncbi:hypothetical protein COY17_01030 [Candidatus Saccharibacteria bacterium CG_4_10_14_0_2_um_filter_52_9]|nr:MAG: hypothetical protein COY17_01030 [Candidatus Saccharibacteria bacterium CG_4_10_14_0_2_um_filter_52_9]